MTEHDLTPRRYSEKEVGLILRRATELQRSEPNVADPTGLTLAELEEIAGEAGIDPKLMRRAALEVAAGVSEPRLLHRLAGEDWTIRLEHTVAGELPESGFDRLVPLIQVATEGHGQASSVGKTLTWSSTVPGNTSSQQVLVASRRGETLIRIEEKLGGLAGGLFGGILGGGTGVAIGLGGALGGILGSTVLAVGFPIVIFGGCYYAAREIFRYQVRKRRRALEDLMARIVEQVEGAVGAFQPESAKPPERVLPGESADG